MHNTCTVDYIMEKNTHNFFPHDKILLVLVLELMFSNAHNSNKLIGHSNYLIKLNQ
jgi:hypothetical protein